MKHRKTDAEKRLQAAAAPYKIGYLKPPEETRFQPGECPNPAGRRRGSKNAIRISPSADILTTIVLTEANRRVPILENGRQFTMTLIEAVLRSLFVAAAKGNTRAQKQALKAVEEAEARAKEKFEFHLGAVSRYAADWVIEKGRRERMGITEPLLPHPEHLSVDPVTGDARLNGPFSQEQKVIWDKLHEHRAMHVESVKACRLDLLTAKKAYHADIKEELNFSKKQIRKIDRSLKLFNRLL